MAIRYDFTIDYDASPRIITIAAPSTECSMQDMHDTLRYMESLPAAMENRSLVDSSGKETLDSTTKVGLTVTLQNAVAGFEARPGPAWVGCAFIGGNLVALNTSGNTVDPLNYTAFVSPSRTSSASATLQEQDALQYSSYQNAVWIDALSNQTGTAFPSGTREFPVNNVQDAVIIGNDKGFSDLHFIGNYDLGAGDNVTNFTLIGQNPMRSFINMGVDAIIANVEIRECTIAGTLDGNATVRECVIWDIDYFSGFIHNSVLTNSIIKLGNNAVALFLHCYSGVPGSGMPTIDMGSSGQSLGLRNYNGGIKIINRIGTDGISLDMNAGQVTIGSDCQGDPAYIRGAYKLTVEAGGVTPYTDGRVLVEQNSTTIGGGLDEAEMHTALDSYTNKDDYKADVTSLSADVNIIEVAGVPVTSIDDFKNEMKESELHAGLNSYDNKTLWQATTVDANIISVTDTAVLDVNDFKASGITVDYDAIGDNIEARTLMTNIKEVNNVPVVDIDDFKATDVVTTVDLTGIAEDIWSYVDRNLTGTVDLTSSQIADIDHIITLLGSTLSADVDSVAGVQVNTIDEFKADLTSIGSDVNVVSVQGTPVVSVDDFKATDVVADLTETNSLIAAVKDDTGYIKTDVQALENYTTIHDDLDSYTGKANWKSDVSVVEGKVDVVQSSIDNLPVPDAMTEAELHTGLDSYVNKDNYKTDVSSLSTDVNVTKVAGVTVNTIEEFKADPTDLTAVNSKLDSIQSDTTQLITDVSNVVMPNYTTLHDDLDSYANKALWKEAADLTLTNAKIDIAIAGIDDIDPYTTLHAELDSYPNKINWTAVADLTGVEADLLSISGDITSISSKVNSLDNYTTIHTDLDSYVNKIDWHVDLTDVETQLTDIETKVDLVPDNVWGWVI